MKQILFILFLLLASACYAEVDLSIIATIESSNNPSAVSFRGAKYGRGLYQISEVCLTDWNNFNPRKQYTAEQLFDPAINREIAEWYLSKRIPQMLRHYRIPVTLENILHAYNAGIGRVRQGIMPEETRKYIRRYKALKEAR